MSARKTLTTKATAPFKFPKRSDFIFDFPKGTDFGLSPLKLPAFKIPKLGNSAGVAKSWCDEKVRAARTQRNGVTVRSNDVATPNKSVAEAFRALRLPMARHIRFRIALKASGRETFEDNGKMYAFELAAE